MPDSRRITLDDFFTGLLAGLASLGVRGLSIRGDNFDRAAESAFAEFRKVAMEGGLAIPFEVRRHRLHGDPAAARDAISRAAQRDLVGYVNPEYQDLRLKLSGEEAQFLLKRLPFEETLAVASAREFLRILEGAKV